MQVIAQPYYKRKKRKDNDGCKLAHVNTLSVICVKAVKPTNLDGGEYGRHIVRGAPAVLKDV